MDINITEDKNNALLNRREIKFTVKFEGPTPSRNDVKGKLVAMLNASLDLTIIQKMDSEYGMQELSGYVKIYEDAARMTQVERDYSIKRNVIPDEPEPEVAEDAEESEVVEE
ncbi:MAG: 30S ribosomal protein S24e [Methanosarcinaceae archaeon]|nr:30S ribosomal protein S24e [Methanosarcinaceae archaeon]